jgi:Lanthionine synthetase C-like protein
MILLECGAEELGDSGPRNYLPWIGETITSLCQICISYNGHLPTSIPPWASSRPSHLVQICHGSPGLLLLLAAARRNTRLTASCWQPQWDEAIRLGTERVWEEGLLSKGGNLCHGLAGNVWPLLMLHDCFEYDVEAMKRAKQAFLERAGTTAELIPPGGLDEDLTGDYFLSRALAFLLLSRDSPPYSTALGINSLYHFRMPDNPYSLFEGLAGILCAWAEACAVILARLRKMELEEGGLSSSALSDDGIFKARVLQQLGFPGLGGRGPRGLI